MIKKIGRYILLVSSMCLIGLQSASAEVRQLTSPTTQSTVKAVTAPSPIGCYDFDSNLKPGAKGVAVRYLQYFLNKEGFSVSTDEFGKFGETTKTAVAQFQERYSLTPAALTTIVAGKLTRAKLNSMYGCAVNPVTQMIQSYTLDSSAPQATASAKLSVINTVLDSNGLTATFCNKGTNDLPTAPFRVRLNGINRDFEITGAQKAGACETDSLPYSVWGLTYDPGSTYTAVSIIDPNGYYKTSQIVFNVSPTTSLSVPSIPGAHLSVRSILIKTTGIQTTLCNLGTTDLSTFPVRITVNGVSKDFDSTTTHGKGVCAAMNVTYDNFNTTFTQGAVYTVTVQADPSNVISESNEFDNTATAVGTP